MGANRSLALSARDLLARALGVAAPAPDNMIGALAALPLPDGRRPVDPKRLTDPLQDELFARGFEVPVVPWPTSPKRLIRVSAHRYNALEDYERLAVALRGLLDAER
jgi:isopenicillin-N epimerase